MIRLARIATATFFAFAIVQLASLSHAQVRADGLTQLIVQEPQGSGGPRVALGVEPKTGQRFVQLAGLPAYPTIDVMCDGSVGRSR